MRSLTAYAQTTNMFESKPLGYLEIYETYFAHKMNESIKLLELGVAGGQSMKMWQDYFCNGLIVGIDLFPKFEPGPDDTRVRIFSGLQNDFEFLKQVSAECAPDGFDIIVDDCAHIGQITKESFWYLFKNHLKPGGIYAIEDWGTGYWGGYHNNVCYPDGARFDPREKQTFMHRLSNSLLKTAPVEWQEQGVIQKFLKRFQYQRRFKGHDYGMVGFVKQLVDELGIGEITGPQGIYPSVRENTAHRLSQFAYVLYSPGVVIVKKIG